MTADTGKGVTGSASRSITVRVEVDLSRCAGYGNCVEAAPAVFQMSDVADIADVLIREPGPELAGSVRKAARVCPADAVVLSEN